VKKPEREREKERKRETKRKRKHDKMAWAYHGIQHKALELHPVSDSSSFLCMA
jgi:hypothetical protein